MTPNYSGTPTVREPTEYDLRIDEQTERFLALRHQLAFFLVTASIVPLGFTLKFVTDCEKPLTWGYWESALFALAGVTALLAAGSALGSIRYDISSHLQHIAARYKRKSYNELPSEKQMEWDRANRLARLFRDSTFVALFLSIAFQAAFFCTVLIVKGK